MDSGSPTQQKAHLLYNVYSPSWPFSFSTFSQLSMGIQWSILLDKQLIWKVCLLPIASNLITLWVVWGLNALSKGMSPMSCWYGQDCASGIKFHDVTFPSHGRGENWLTWLMLYTTATGASASIVSEWLMTLELPWLSTRVLYCLP